MKNTLLHQKPLQTSVTNPPSTTSILRKAVWSLFAFSIAITLGVYFFWGDSVDELLANMEPSQFGWALFLLSLGLPTVAFRWRSLLAPEEKKRVNPVFMTSLLMISHLFNISLPGPAGEGLSGWVLHKKYDVDFGNALSALLVSRILGLVSAFLIACSMFAVAPFVVSPEYVDKLVYVSIFLGILGAAASSITLFPAYPKRLLQRIRTLKLLQQDFIQRLFDFADKLLESFIATAKRGLPAYLEAFFWCVVGHSMVALGVYYTVLALGYSVSWTAVFFTYSASIIFSLVMFMFPGSTVGFDVLFSGILHVTGNLPLEIAVLVASVVRFHQSLIAILGGALMLFSSKELVEEAMTFARTQWQSSDSGHGDHQDTASEKDGTS